MLDLDTHQGRFGEHLVLLTATAAGYTCYKPDDTGDGVDLVISHTQHDGKTIRPPNVEVAVKTVRAPSIVNDQISYDLKINHYNALRGRGPTRRYLVVVIVPGNEPRLWFGQGNAFTVFQRGAYCLDLLDAPDTSNTSTIAVHVPLANRYTPQMVQAQMANALRDFKAQFGLPEAS